MRAVVLPGYAAALEIRDLPVPDLCHSDLAGKVDGRIVLVP